MKENCIDCRSMQVLLYLENNTKFFSCIKAHISSDAIKMLYEKKLNHKGQIDGMTHRLEFKKAKTCPDFDDMRPDEQDKENWKS